MPHFIPLNLKTEEHMKDMALMFVKTIWGPHGHPETIKSDRDTRFTSKFWMSLMQLWQIKLNVLSVFHPETAGQTERGNQILVQYLCCNCSYQQDDWLSLLPFVDQAFNISLSQSAKLSPFEINYRFTPLTEWWGMLSDNQGIHADSMRVVKYWEGIC